MATAVKHREELIAENQGLVRSLALKIHKGLPSHVDLDDLISYGQVGLAEAAADYDPQRGEKFTTFAWYRVRGAIYDGLSKMAWIKRSQYNRIKYEQMANDVLRLENEGYSGRPGTAQEELLWMRNVSSALAVVYLSSRAKGDDDEQDMQLADRNAQAPSAALMNREVNQKLHQLIDELPPDAASIVRATYFEGLTLTEAGKRLNIGKAWASRLHARALERLARGLSRSGVADER